MNKKWTILIFSILAGCAQYYGLSKQEFTRRQHLFSQVRQYTQCLNFQDFNRFINSGYTIKDIVDTVRKNPSPLCYYDLSGKYSRKIEYQLQLLIEKKKQILYKQLQQKEEDENRRKEEERQQRKKARLYQIENETGYRFCTPDTFDYYLTAQKQIPQYCLLRFGFFPLEVDQQTPEGTLVSIPFSHSKYGGYRRVFITSNPIDRELFTGQFVPQGAFIGQGNYTYTTILGGSNTVSRIKRLR